MRQLTETHEMALTLRLAADVSAPGAARRALHHALADRVAETTLQDAIIVASELVANGVMHAGASSSGRVELRVAMGSSSLCVKVIDDGWGFDAEPRLEPDPAGFGGRGLMVVERLAADWGHERVGGRTVVWAEIPH